MRCFPFRQLELDKDWAELGFAKTSGTVTRNREKKAFCNSWSCDQLSVNTKIARFLKSLLAVTERAYSILVTCKFSAVHLKSSDCNGRWKVDRFIWEKQLLPPVNFEVFKLSLNLSLTNLRAQIACYECKGDLSPIMLKDILNYSLKISKFTRICRENHSSVNGWQELFFPCKCF